MNKISSIEAAGLLKTASQTIRGLVTENQGLREKVAVLEHEDRVEKIARQMEGKGLMGELSFEQKVAKLREARNLDVTEEAVKLAAPGGHELVGQTADEQHPGAASSAFEAFIMTGDTP